MPTPFALPPASLAVVTGGGDGIGAAIALALADAGATVVVAGRGRAKVANGADTGRDAGWSVAALPVDVSDVASIQALADAVLADHGRPTILVNSAGASITMPALEVSEADWDLVLDVGLRGTFFACQVFARAMADGGYGKIVNLGSTWGATVGVNRSTYSVAKAGVHHLTAALGAEWAPLGIRVNALAPTTTRTPRVDELYAAHPERQEYAVARIPMGRIAEPADVTGGALFLCGSASDFVTGHTLFVDGGWHHSK
jgi:NAD(P)-dependent dehydrogenase (short-subunit alcohol dehydrogenase family)